jgi:thiol-disulfide isomerase/thioredoxin
MVPAFLLGARLILAAVLTGAGISKLADRDGAREALKSFGVPTGWAGLGAVALPVVELVVAAALIPLASAWWAALAALGLLLLFSAVIGRVLARGERPDCRCFGQLRPQPVGWSTLVRNAGLAALALIVLALGRQDPGPSVLGWLEPLGPAHRVLATIGAVAVCLLASLTVLTGWLIVQQRRLLARLEGIEAQLDEGTPAAAEREEARPPDKGLPIGAPAPTFVLPDLGGAPRSLATLLEARRPVLLLFGSSGCDPCAALAPDLVRWQREHAAIVSLVVVSSGTPEENRQKLPGLAADRLLLQTESEVADAYAAQWTPGAVLIGRTGRIASAVTYGDQAIRALVARVVAAPDAPVVGSPDARRDRGALSIVRSGGPPGLGDSAPPLSRADLDGGTLDLRDYRGRDTLVVFWQPNCPHCQRLAEDLRRWEAEPPRGAPRLLIVSSGAVDENRALAFKSSVVLDEGFQIGKAFGARGTPSAVLVDAHGRIASTVAVGARDVLALAGLVPPVRTRGTASSA